RGDAAQARSRSLCHLGLRHEPLVGGALPLRVHRRGRAALEERLVEAWITEQEGGLRRILLLLQKREEDRRSGHSDRAKGDQLAPPSKDAKDAFEIGRARVLGRHQLTLRRSRRAFVPPRSPLSTNGRGSLSPAMRWLDRGLSVTIVYVVGARPNMVKMAPVIAELRRRLPETRHAVVHTGQHYDR